MARKAIKGITIEIGGDTTKLQDALKDVETKIRGTETALRDVDRLLKLDPGNTELLTQKQSELQTAIEGTREKLETLKTAQEQFQAEGKTDTAEWDTLQREIIETEQNLQSLTTQMEQFGSVGAQQIAAAGEQVKAVGEKITGVGEAVMPVSEKLISLGKDAALNFAETDKTLQLVNATMGNTEEQAKLLEDAIAQAAANSTFGMDDATNAALNFARAGLDAEQAAAALAPAMNLAAGEGGNLDTVSAGLVATINGFGDDFENTGHYADVFAQACNKSALDVDSLSRAMSIAAPVFRTAGYTVEDATLYLGTMANNGIDANKAATSLKTGLARLVAPAKEGAEAMSKLGIEVTNADGSMKDTMTVQKELHDAFVNQSESEQIAAASAIFGKNQMAPWLALINTAPEDVAALSTELSNCSGVTDEMANAMMSGFGGSIERLQSSLDVLMNTLGGLVAEILQPIIDAIQGAVNWLLSLDEGTQRIIVTIGAVVAAAGPLLVAIGGIVTAIGNVMTLAPQILTFIEGAKGLVSGFIALISAHPIVAAITAVVAIIATLYAKCEWFRDGVHRIWEGIKSFFGGLPAFFSGIGKSITDKWEQLKSGAKEKFDSVVNTVKGAVDKLKNLFNFEWKLPHIPLPHFKVTGELDLLRLPPKVPSLSIEWYKKAMDNGRILTHPTIFGASGGQLLGGGEAGAEAVVGVSSLRDMVQSAVRDAAPGNVGVVRADLIVDHSVLGRMIVQLGREENQRLGVRLVNAPM